MVDLRPQAGERRTGVPSLGKDLTLLVVEYEGTSTYGSDGSPIHHLDVQVAMFDGANEHLRRQSNPHLHAAAMRPGGSGNPLVPYSADQMLEVVTAAWQQDDPASDSREFSDRTEQNVLARDGSRVLGTVYVVNADVAVGDDRRARIVPGSVRKADEALVPDNVMAAQREACGKAWVAEAPERDAAVARAAEARNELDRLASAARSREQQQSTGPQL